jgi:hypothetical protein
MAIAVMFAATLILTLGTAAVAQDISSPYRSFDAPHAGTGSGQGTFPTAINLHGWIAGTVVHSDGTSHGFLRKTNTTYIAVDVPGAVQTVVSAINSSDAVVGSYYATNTTNGFLRDKSGNYTPIAYPGAYSTNPTGINGTGVVVGFASVTGQAGVVAFLWDAQNGFTTFAVPWANANSTIPLAINGAGSVTGFYSGKYLYTHGFVRNRNGTVAPFDGTSDEPTQTESLAINASGQTTGWTFSDDSGETPGFLRDPDGTITFVGLAASPGNAGAAINDKGVVVGYYFSDGGGNGSFEQDASGNIINLGTELPFTNTANNAVGINSVGTIIGNYTDANGAVHGWLKIP